MLLLLLGILGILGELNLLSSSYSTDRLRLKGLEGNVVSPMFTGPNLILIFTSDLLKQLK